MAGSPGCSPSPGKDEPAESGLHSERGKIVAADAADGQRIAMAFGGEV